MKTKIITVTGILLFIAATCLVSYTSAKLYVNGHPVTASGDLIVTVCAWIFLFCMAALEDRNGQDRAAAKISRDALRAEIKTIRERTR